MNIYIYMWTTQQPRLFLSSVVYISSSRSSSGVFTNIYLKNESWRVFSFFLHPKKTLLITHTDKHCKQGCPREWTRRLPWPRGSPKRRPKVCPAVSHSWLWDVNGKRVIATVTLGGAQHSQPASSDKHDASNGRMLLPRSGIIMVLWYYPTTALV
jgi:hypothetical protein